MTTIETIIKDCKSQIRIDNKAVKICKSHTHPSENARAKFYEDRILKCKFTIELLEKYL